MYYSTQLAGYVNFKKDFQAILVYAALGNKQFAYVSTQVFSF